MPSQISAAFSAWFSNIASNPCTRYSRFGRELPQFGLRSRERRREERRERTGGHRVIAPWQPLPPLQRGGTGSRFKSINRTFRLPSDASARMGATMAEVSSVGAKGWATAALTGVVAGLVAAHTVGSLGPVAAAAGTV